MWIDHTDQGVSLIVRYNLHSLNLYDAEGQKIEVEAVLRTTSAMELCQPVQVRGTILGKTMRNWFGHFSWINP